MSIYQQNNQVFIIAEAGVNHNGSLELAYKLVDLAQEAGANAVKFQTFRAENIASKNAPKAEYQKRTTGTQETQFDMLKKLELDEAVHLSLIEYCKKKEIAFLSTPFDLESVDLLAQLGLEIFKIPSGEITNLPYLRKIGRLQKKVIMSTGMCDLADVEKALNALVDEGLSKEKIVLLHCHSDYPTAIEDVNLRAMKSLQHAFGVGVGYSDHTPGIEIPIAAVALGAVVIEKHFTLDKEMEGPDHKASLDGQELKEMVRTIRNVELALGDGIKRPTKTELKNRLVMRKSVHIKNDLSKGHILCEADLTMKRPGDGISPMMMDNLIGRELICDVLKGNKLQWTQVK